MKIRGFSIMELLVVLTISALVVAIAFPSLKNLWRKNQDQTQSTELLAAVNLARSEAILRSKPVRLLPRNDKWEEGYIISLADGEVLHVFQTYSFGKKVYWRSAQKGHNYLEFLPLGISRMGNGSFLNCWPPAADPSWAVVLNQTGRARLVFPDAEGQVVDLDGNALVCIY